MRIAAVFWAAILLAPLPALAAAADTNDCPTPINGPLKGQSGNNRDDVFHSLAIDPADPNTVYVGTEANGIFKTTDRGQTWTRLRTGLKCTIAHSFYSQIFDIAIDPANRQTLYASAINGPGPSSPVAYPSASGGVYKSTDGGATWTQKNAGLPSTYVTTVLVDARQAGRLYAVVGGLNATYPTAGAFIDGGVYVSTNAGDSWAPLALPAGVEKNIFVNAVIRGADQRRLYASGQVHQSDAPQAYGFLRSTDAGATWSISNPAGEAVSGFDVFGPDPNIIYANVASGRRAYKSADGGATWTATGPTIFFGVTRIHPQNSQVAYYTGGAGSIWRTTDGFATVGQVFNDTTLASDQRISDIRIAPSNGNVIWAAAIGYYLYRSVDGGQSWTKITGVRDLVYGTSAAAADTAAITVAPVSFSGTSSLTSFLRLVNPTATAGTARVDVRDDQGVLLGTYIRPVAANSAPQIPFSVIEADAGVVLPARAGAFAQLEIKADFAGFAQHVIYDSANGVFANLSQCRSTATNASTVTGSAGFVANAHTSNIATHPSRITLSNGDAAPVAAVLEVRDSATGAVIGTWTSSAIPASGEIVVPVSQVQQGLGLVPTADQSHVTLTLQGSSRIVLGHYVDSLLAGGRSDMTVRCAFAAAAL